MRKLMAVLALCGCAPNMVWLKPGWTMKAFKADDYECTRDARSTFRDRAQTIVSIDEDLYNQCMEARGWHQEERK